MKTVLGLVLFLACTVAFSKKAEAGTGLIGDPAIVAVSLSTATSCTITVSTGTSVRVDNFNGKCTGLMLQRTEFELCVPTGGTTVHLAYTINVSTDPLKVNYGKEVKAGNCANPGVNKNVTGFAIAEDAAGVSGQNVYLGQGGSTVSTPGAP